VRVIWFSFIGAAILWVLWGAAWVVEWLFDKNLFAPLAVCALILVVFFSWTSHQDRKRERLRESYAYPPVNHEIQAANRRKGESGIGYKRLKYNYVKRVWVSPTYPAEWPGDMLIASTDPFYDETCGIHFVTDPNDPRIGKSKYPGDIVEIEYWGARIYDDNGNGRPDSGVATGAKIRRVV